MASGVQVAVALRLKQARQKVAKGQQQQHQHHRLPSNVATRNIKPFPVYPPVWNSPRRIHTAWDGSSEPSASGAGASQLGTGLEGSHEKVVDQRLRADKAYKKWLRKHKVADSLSTNYRAVGYKNGTKITSSIDLILWIGLAILMTGTIVSFVGLGEKGFRSSELRLLGPILSGFGFALCVIRIGLCCLARNKKTIPSDEDVHVGEELARAIRVPHVVAVQSIHYSDSDEFSMKNHDKKKKSQLSLPLKTDEQVHDKGSIEDLIQVTHEDDVSDVIKVASDRSLVSQKSSSQQTITAVIENNHPISPVTGARSKIPRPVHVEVVAQPILSASSSPELVLNAGQLKQSSHPRHRSNTSKLYPNHGSMSCIIDEYSSNVNQNDELHPFNQNTSSGLI